MTSSVRRIPTRRRRRYPARGLKSLMKLALTLAVLIFILVNVIRFSNSQKNFIDGIYVNGISLGGYSYQDGYNLVHEQAEKRLNGNPITLSYAGKTWSLTPAMLSASMDIDTQLALAWNFGHTGNVFQQHSQRKYLSENKVEFNSELTYDAGKLDEFIAGIKSEIDIPVVNASVVMKSNEELEFTQSSPGREMSADAIRNALKNVIVEGSAPNIELVPQVIEPEIPTEALESGIELIGSCTTSTKGSTKNRVSNIRQALKQFNGIEMHPEEVLTFNKIVGKRTEENHFKEAPEFSGYTIQDGIGGGVCQASTTLYNALLRAGITVEERHQHSMTVGYIKPSLDATVSDNGKDLIFTNNRNSSIYIYTNVSSGEATVNIYGKKPEYKIKLESEILQDNIRSKTKRKKKDTTGKHVYYTDDEPVLASEGKTGMRSRAFICYYDWNTGALVNREELHEDYYFPQDSIYWVGVHERDEAL